MNLRLRYVLFLLLFTSKIGSAQVLNSSFELWTDSFPNYWNCNNFPPVLFPVTQTTDAYSGVYAAKGEVVSYNGSAVPPTLYPLSTNGYGFPITQKYVSFYTWYKSTLIGTDLCTVSIVMYHSSGLSIGIGFAYMPAAANYTLFSVPISYTSNYIPSYALITFSMADSTGNGFNVGSNFIVDDVGLSMVAGINPVESPSFNLYPNPVKDIINIQGEFKSDEKYMIGLVNSAGQLVLNKSVRSSATGLPPIDASTFPEGTYLLVVSDSKQSLTQRVLISK